MTSLPHQIITRTMRDHGSRELLRAAEAAEYAEARDQVPTFRTLAEMERDARWQRDRDQAERIRENADHIASQLVDMAIEGARRTV